MHEPFLFEFQFRFNPFNRPQADFNPLQSFPKPQLHGLNNFQANHFSLFETILNRTLVVYAAVESAHGSFICRTPERIKRPDWETKGDFCIITEFEIRTKDLGQHYSRCSADYTVPAGVLGKWRCLQQWAPALIQISIDIGFRSNDIAPVFFIPATDECVIQSY